MLWWQELHRVTALRRIPAKIKNDIASSLLLVISANKENALPLVRRFQYMRIGLDLKNLKSLEDGNKVMPVSMFFLILGHTFNIITKANYVF